MWCKCPSCGESTAYDGTSGKRCVPCGYGLVPRGKEASPERSRKAANFLSGGKRP